MPQIQLPIFPEGLQAITREIAFERRAGQVYYFNGHLPVFIHADGDLASFRLFSSQLVINGNATHSQIARAFGVPLVSVKRAVKRYREGGPKVFFTPSRRQRGSRLTPERLVQAQALLDEGQEVQEVAEALAILTNTLHKAIRAGRLHLRVKKKPLPELTSPPRPKANAV